MSKGTIALWIGGLALGGGLLYLVLRPKPESLAPSPEPAAPASSPPVPAPGQTGFYPSAAERDKRIADATAAAQSGDPAKLAAALARLSPEDRAKLQSMLPHFPAAEKPQSVPFYGTTTERDKRLAEATAAAQSGDSAKLAAALAKLSPEDRAKLQSMFPHL